MIVTADAASPAVRTSTRWIAYAAVLAALPYAVSRIAWAFGIPLGIDAAKLEEMNAPGLGSIYLLTLAVVSELPGAIVWRIAVQGRLTVPCRVPKIEGRRVPLLAAVAIPTLAAAFLLAVGLPGAYQAVADFDALRERIDPEISGPDWALTAQMMQFAAWGTALAAAAVMIYMRRPGESARRAA